MVGRKLNMNKAYTNWKEQGQPSELAHHKNSKSRSSDDRWMKETEGYLTSFGYKKKDFVGKKIIDLGAGSKLRTLWFDESYIIAIEPLADKFKSIYFCDLDKADELYSEPAEKFLENLKEEVDAIMCINVLDHCYDAETIMKNCYNYLKEDGEMLLSVDLHDGRDAKHPIKLNDGILKELIKNTGFKIKREYPIVHGLYSGSCSGITLVLSKNLDE